MASEEWVKLPPQVVKGPDIGQSADTPKLDVLIGETVCLRGLEWIGEKAPYEGVRLFLHIVQGEQMTKAVKPYRAYTEAVLRVARQLASNDESRTVKFERWPLYKVVKSGASYALADV